MMTTTSTLTLPTCQDIGTNTQIHPCSKRERVDKEGKQCKSEFVFEFLTPLTEEILVEILIRLPNKSCCRYKAVCKCWNSLISSSFFISRYMNHCRHLNNNRPAPNCFTIVFNYEVRGPAPYGFIKYLYHIEAITTHPLLSKSYRKHRVDLSFLPTIGLEGRSRETVTIKASCHDLLLCAYYKTYYIVNLLTRQWIVLPSRPSCFDTPIGQQHRVSPDPKVGFLCCHDQSDVNNGDGWYKFKVVLAPLVCTDGFKEYDPEFNASRFTICIFCSESRQWTEFVVDWYPFRLTSFLRVPIIAHDGMLHWHAGHSVVSFDPFSVDDGDLGSRPTPRLSRIVNLPDELALVTPLGLGVCRGCIQLVYRRLDNHEVGPVLQVWQLKEEEEVWHLSHNVLLGNLSLRKHGICSTFEFVGFHPFNPSIIFLRTSKTICEFNMRTRRCGNNFRLKLGKAVSIPFRCNVVPPLLHRWFPTPVPSPSVTSL